MIHSLMRNSALMDTELSEKIETNMEAAYLYIFVYVRSDIPCRQIKTLEMTNIESIVLELHVNKTKYLIVTTYKPPNVHNNTFTLEMTDFMDIASQRRTTTRHVRRIWAKTANQ